MKPGLGVLLLVHLPLISALPQRALHNLGSSLSPELEAAAAVAALNASLNRDEPGLVRSTRVCLPRPVDPECPNPGSYLENGPKLAETTLAALRAALKGRGYAKDTAEVSMQRPLLRGDTIYVNAWVVRSAKDHIKDPDVLDMYEYEVRMVIQGQQIHVTSSELVSVAELRRGWKLGDSGASNPTRDVVPASFLHSDSREIPPSTHATAMAPSQTSLAHTNR